MRYSLVELEECYQRLRSLGRPVDYAGRSFTHFDLRPFLERVLSTLTFPGSTPAALEYGTGTGLGACFLAARGFQVDAIDIAPTAIELARRFAAEQGLTIHYSIQDICTYRAQGKLYDLVVDNFCLQRLVPQQRRARALAVVRGLLKPSGYFLLGTAIYRDGYSLREDEFRDEQTGIIYRKLPAHMERYEDLVVRVGELLYPKSRVVRPESLRHELEEAGFCLLRQEDGQVLCRAARANGRKEEPERG